MERAQQVFHLVCPQSPRNGARAGRVDHKTPSVGITTALNTAATKKRLDVGIFLLGMQQPWFDCHSLWNSPPDSWLYDSQSTCIGAISLFPLPLPPPTPHPPSQFQYSALYKRWGGGGGGKGSTQGPQLFSTLCVTSSPLPSLLANHRPHFTQSVLRCSSHCALCSAFVCLCCHSVTVRLGERRPQSNPFTSLNTISPSPKYTTFE